MIVSTQSNFSRTFIICKKCMYAIVKLSSFIMNCYWQNIKKNTSYGRIFDEVNRQIIA